MSITLQVEGRRIYFVGNTFGIKDRIKQAGGKWDADRRAWWIGTTQKDKAEELVADVAQQPEQPRGC